MESENKVGKIIKGIAAVVLTIFTLRGLHYNFRGNWLVSIAVVVGMVIVLYQWGLKSFGTYLWKRKWRTIGAVICGVYIGTSTPDEAGLLTFIENCWAGFLIGSLLLFFFAKPILMCVRMVKHDAFYGSDSGSYSSSTSRFSTHGSDKWEREQQEAEQARREADQRAKERYDARTNELKAEYDARTAAGWGKDRAAQNFKDDADYWRKQQKKY